MEFEDRIVVHEVEQVLRAQSESQDDLARLEVLARAGDHARFDQRNHAVGDQFAVNAQVLAVHQQGQHRIRNAADAGLQHRAVFDQAGDVARDRDLQIGDYGLLQRAQRPRRLDERINVVDVDEAVAVGARHLVVDLRDHVLRHSGGGQRGIDADAKAAEAVGIRRRDFDQRDIDRHLAAFEQPFDFAEIDGRVIGAAVVDGLAHVAADEHRVVAEVARHLRRHVGRAAHGHHVDDFYIENIGRAPDQRFDQRFRLGAARLNVDAHSGLHAAQRLVCRLQPLFVFHLP